jgi:DNA-directed RNA polymerase subunit RPC12/RpoP
MAAPSPGAGGDPSVSSETSEIVCPHCKKTFTAQLIDGAAERYRGFKCPHCKLFVPAERVAE